MRRIYIVLALLVFVAGAAIGIVQRQRKIERVRVIQQCDADVAELREWLRVLAIEGVMMPLYEHEGDRIVERETPDLPLVRVDARPAPLPFLGALTLSRSRVAFGAASAPIGDGEGIANVLLAVDARGLSPSFGFGGIGHGEVHPFLVLVGAGERWEDVVTLVARARDAGFAQALFAFEVQSHVSPPPAGRGLDTMLAIEKDLSVGRGARDRNASLRLISDGSRCPNAVAALKAQPITSLELDILVKDVLEPAPDAIAACACRIDIDEVKAFAWTRFGRHWGKTTVTYTVDLARSDHDDAPLEIAARADAKWSEVHARVIEASKESRPVKLLVR